MLSNSLTNWYSKALRAFENQFLFFVPREARHKKQFTILI